VNYSVNNKDSVVKVKKELTKESSEQVYLSASKVINPSQSQFKMKVFAQTTKVGQYIVGAEVEDKRSGVVSTTFGKTKRIELSVTNAKAPNITELVFIDCDVK
jgi:hypothetical protein